MEKVFVVGSSMTSFGKLYDLSIKDLTRATLSSVLEDAGSGRSCIQAAFFANTTQGHFEGQHSVRGQVALRSAGLASIPMINVENACAGGSSAFNLAVQFVRSGEGDMALAVGVEKLFNKDKAKMFAAFDSAVDLETWNEEMKELKRLGEGLEIPEGSTSDKPYSVFMDIYAAFARFHMKNFGTTQRQIAAVAAKNHEHSVHNPQAQYQIPMTIEEVLGAPPITYPITMPMCSPVSDGASAALVCSESGLKRHGLDRSRAIEVLACVVQTGSSREPDEFHRHITRLAAQNAYEKACVGPDDISVAEVHDATAFAEIFQTEALGFCGVGEGGLMAEKGETKIGGRIPVNPSGGLESRGHPISATGLAQIYELVTQLRGEAGKRQVDKARFAIAENGGGALMGEEAVACITILGK